MEALRKKKEILKRQADRLQKVVEDVNSKNDVEGLCRGWPKRLVTLEEKDGNHIGK